VRALLLVVSLTAQTALAADIVVDADAGTHAISPMIYGVNAGQLDQMRRMGATLRRLGGNAWQRYNYQASTSNTGGDGYFFENVVFTDGGPDYAAQFAADSIDAGFQVMLDLPVLGFVSKPGSSQVTPHDCGFRVTKY
jgi:hypothetical protein